MKDTPFFLAECRRKTFVKVYYLDKIFATVFNRPPRISSRYADCELPLDISDEELFATTPETLSEIKDNLTHDGWNTDKNYRIATSVRLRYILREFREEIVEYQIRSTQSIDVVKLRYLVPSLNLQSNPKPQLLGICPIDAIGPGAASRHILSTIQIVGPQIFPL